ncbi:MAG: hypothetical protein ABSG44_02275 [Thermodesulfobacteriota bacterium]|jgi:hypothetical protein
MLTVFGDESHDEKQQRIFAVAGIMGTQEEWDRLKPEWNERLKNHPWNPPIEEPSFHAADCDADQEDFKGIPHETNQQLYKDLVTLLVKANMVGFGVIMDLVAYGQYFPGYMPSSPYQLCFHRVVTWFAQNTYMYQPHQQVKFIFDVSENNFSTGFLYDNLVHSSGWKYAQQLFEELGFAGRKSVGIQAGDILAREGMKHFDNFFISLSGRDTRSSMQALGKTGRYVFRFIGKDDFETFIQQSETEEWKRIDEELRGYESWLNKNGLADNQTNRNKYFVMLQNKGKK